MTKITGDVTSGGSAAVPSDPTGNAAAGGVDFTGLRAVRAEDEGTAPAYRESLGVDGVVDAEEAVAGSDMSGLRAMRAEDQPSANPTYAASDAEGRDGSGGAFTMDTGEGDAFMSADETEAVTPDMHGDRLVGPEQSWAIADADASDPTIEA